MVEEEIKITEKVISPSGLDEPLNGMKGWNVKDFIVGYFDIIGKNWDNIVEVLKWAGPVILGWKFFQENPTLVIPFSAIGKAVLDIIHYWLVEKKKEVLSITVHAQPEKKQPGELTLKLKPKNK